MVMGMDVEKYKGAGGYIIKQLTRCFRTLYTVQVQ